MHGISRNFALGLRGMGAAGPSKAGAAPASASAPVDSFTPAKGGMGSGPAAYSPDAYGWHKLRQELISLVKPG